MSTSQTLMGADDALKYAAAKLAECTDWACDSIGGSMCDTDHDVETNAIANAVADVQRLAAQFGDPRTYSDGRRVVTKAEIVPGFVTQHIWKLTGEEPSSWRGNLPSGDPDLPSPGKYEVTADPTTQQLHVRVLGGAA